MTKRQLLLIACAILVPASALAQPYEFRRTLLYPVPDQANLRGPGDPVSKIIYVNGCQPAGCVISAGDHNDSIDDISTIPPFTSVLSAFDYPPETWDQAIACIREVYAPYDVEIVTQDPGNVPHHEAILAGAGNEFDLPADVLGVAPFSCTAQDNAISFSFANSMGDDWLRMCWTVAQESAHAFGLDHEFDCRDPMTYIDGCGQKYFRDLDLPCGDFDLAPCKCGGDTQNSHERLRAVFGPGITPPPPEVAITYPVDQAAVDDQFVVSMIASDRRLIHRIEVYVNGWLYTTLEGHNYSTRDDSYVFDPPDDLPEGVMHIEVIAYNDLDLSSSAAISVTKGTPCAGNAACLDGQECRDGGCYWLPPTGQIGDECTGAMSCESLLCPQSGETRLCSQYCEFGFQGQCPRNYECVRLQNDPNTSVCWPSPQSDGGCQASPGGTSQGTGFALFLAVVLFGLARRRRPLAAR